VAVGNFKGVSVNYAIVFFSGLVLLVAGVLIFLLILKSIYGNFDLKDILPTPENLTYLFVEKESNIAILYSEYWEAILPEGSTWVSDNVDAWESFAKSSKLYYDIITDQTIELGEHFNYDLIILPGAKALSDREIVQLKRYMELGGSVLATGGTASYSNEGKWRGWQFFTEVFGLNFSKEIKPTEIYKIHTLRGNLPITAGIPTGFTLKIATWDRPIYAEILEPRTKQVSFWYDFRREAGLVREAIQKSAGIAYGNYGEGRFVWYGFELNSVVGDAPVDFINYDRLFRNSIAWLTYEPIAFIRDWPPPYQAASIFIPTLDEDVGNVRNLVELLKSSRYPATFFMSPTVAQQNSTLMKSLAKYGDFGAILDIGYLESKKDTVNKLFPQEEQFKVVDGGVEIIQNITGEKVHGIMPYYGFYDDATLQSMANNEIDFVVTDSLTDRSVPEVKIRNDQAILQITKTARDDYEIIRGYNLRTANFQNFTYQEDIDRIVFEGGLYVYKVHSSYQLRPEYVRVVDDVLKYTRSKNMWLTSIEELKRWWLKRGRIELQFSTSSKVRMEVEVSNLAEERIDNFVIEIDLNKKVQNVDVSSDLVNTTIPEFEFRPENNTLYLYIQNLGAGESRSFLIDYENISG